MKSSFKIFEILGISVKLHISFILFILFIILLYSLESVEYGIKSLILLTSLFLIVLLHELSHSIVAIKFKFKVRDIILFPFGGAADVEIKENPKAEFFIASAGPLFNFLFAWICFIILFLITPEISTYLNYYKIFGLEFPLNFEGILGVLVWINFLLGAFNIFFPAFPMDGGRILRSLLAMKFNYVLATKYAFIISKILLASLLLFFGIFGIIGMLTTHSFQPMWSFMWISIIVIFLFLAGETETKFVEIREKFKNIKARDIAKQIFEIDGALKVKDLEYLLNYSDLRIFPVFLNGKIYGSINIEKIYKKDKEKYIYEISDKDFTYIDAESYISDEFEKFFIYDLVVVIDKNFNIVIGYITRDILREKI